MSLPKIQVLRCTARHQYVARSAVELSLARGNVVHILKSDQSNWWYGECNGKLGYVPKSYLSSNPPPVVISPQLAYCLYKNNAESNPGEIYFEAGETIYILEKDDNSEWWYGMSADFKRSGYFPGAYVDLIVEKEKESERLDRVETKQQKRPKKPDNETLRIKKDSDLAICLKKLNEEEKASDENKTSDEAPPPPPPNMSSNEENAILNKFKANSNNSSPSNSRPTTPTPPPADTKPVLKSTGSTGNIVISNNLAEMEKKGGPPQSAPKPPSANPVVSTPATPVNSNAHPPVVSNSTPTSNPTINLSVQSACASKNDVSPTAQRLAEKGAPTASPAKERRGIKPSERHGWRKSANSGGNERRLSNAAPPKKEEEKEKEVCDDDLEFDDLVDLPPIDEPPKKKSNENLSSNSSSNSNNSNNIKSNSSGSKIEAFSLDGDDLMDLPPVETSTSTKSKAKTPSKYDQKPKTKFVSKITD